MSGAKTSPYSMKYGWKNMFDTRRQSANGKVETRRGGRYFIKKPLPTWFLVWVEDALPADAEGHQDHQEEHDEVDHVLDHLA